jgi:GTP-binding protein
VGYPNVGKTSLIARISAAKPKIADYPFTTLVPNLGVVRFGDAGVGNFVVADVPGIIVGAHLGAGLGTRFLKHVERVKWIVHMVTVVPDEPGREVIQDFEAIENEIRLHNAELMSVRRVLVLNRTDLDFVRDEQARLEAYAREHDIPFFAVSAVTGEGVQALINFIGEAIVRSKTPERGSLPY